MLQRGQVPGGNRPMEGPDGSSPVPLKPFLDRVAATHISPNVGMFIGQGSVREAVAVFDPATVGDRATFERPHQYAEGVSLVAVNGQVAFENGAMTTARPGRVLYGPAVARREEGR